MFVLWVVAYRIGLIYFAVIFEIAGAGQAAALMAECWQGYASVESGVPDVFVGANFNFAFFVVREDENDLEGVGIFGHLLVASSAIDAVA